jgi:hypothetical protein
VGLVELAVLAVYAASLAVFAVVGKTSGVAGRSEVADPVLVVLLLVFVVLVGLVLRALWRRRAAARVPFLLLQLFTVVAAWPLATGGLAWERVLGIVLVVGAAVAAYLMLSPAGSAELER